MAHTPTPWHIERESDEYTLRGANREWIANNTNYYPSAPNEDDAEFIVTAVNAYEANQAEIERLRDFIQSIKTHGELANIPVGHEWGSSGKKPASKDVWCFPRHMLNDLDAALEPKP